jgi:ferredoxin
MLPRRQQTDVFRCLPPRVLCRAQIRASQHNQCGQETDEGAGYTARLQVDSGTIGLEDDSVAYIICEPCVGTKDTACVDVCPVDCIHPRKDEEQFQSADMLYIHPDECIDCGACVPACPVEAIFALDETPEKWKHFIPVNAQFYQK